MNEKNYIVYEIINEITNERYIGLTSQTLKLRFRNGKGYKIYTKINQAILKYGWENFTHCILFETTDKELAEEKEKYYIKKYDTINNGYNKQRGGLKATNYEITALHRQHLSESHKGKHYSPRTEFKKGDNSHCKKIKVLCVELDKVYESIIEAEEELNISHHIWDCLNGKRNKCGGYHWRRENEVCQEE